MPVYVSENLIDWKYTRDSFTLDQMPSGIDRGGIWAPDVIHHNGKYLMAYSYSKGGEYYYLFASVGRCCLGDNSSYRVVVGRSKNLFGPYLDSDENKMLENGYKFVLGSNVKFVGLGHGSKLITDNDGKTWYIYHSYARGKADKGRQPMLDEMRWDKEGWPYIY